MEKISSNSENTERESTLAIKRRLRQMIDIVYGKLPKHERSRAFAKAIGIKNPQNADIKRISQWLNPKDRHAVDFDELRKIALSHNVNYNWLKSESGTMFEDVKEPQQIADEEYLTEADFKRMLYKSYEQMAECQREMREIIAIMASQQQTIAQLTHKVTEREKEGNCKGRYVRVAKRKAGKTPH